MIKSEDLSPRNVINKKQIRGNTKQERISIFIFLLLLIHSKNLNIYIPIPQINSIYIWRVNASLISEPCWRAIYSANSMKAMVNLNSKTCYMNIVNYQFLNVGDSISFRNNFLKSQRVNGTLNSSSIS